MSALHYVIPRLPGLVTCFSLSRKIHRSTSRRLSGISSFGSFSEYEGDKGLNLGHVHTYRWERPREVLSGGPEYRGYIGMWTRTIRIMLKSNQGFYALLLAISIQTAAVGLACWRPERASKAIEAPLFALSARQIVWRTCGCTRRQGPW